MTSENTGQVAGKWKPVYVHAMNASIYVYATSEDAELCHFVAWIYAHIGILMVQNMVDRAKDKRKAGEIAEAYQLLRFMVGWWN